MKQSIKGAMKFAGKQVKLVFKDKVALDDAIKCAREAVLFYKACDCTNCCWPLIKTISVLDIISDMKFDGYDWNDFYELLYVSEFKTDNFDGSLAEFVDTMLSDKKYCPWDIYGEMERLRAIECDRAPIDKLAETLLPIFEFFQKNVWNASFIDALQKQVEEVRAGNDDVMADGEEVKA